ncbi:MAG: nucleotide exchange factor GrpE [Opitutales bacterium]|nr:nucleotide exchange factor GrpE [Opitutales bacterium]
MKDKKIKKLHEENEAQSTQQTAATEAAEQAVEPETGSEVDPLLQKLDEVTGQMQEYKDRYVRLVADFENFRKRSLREKDEVRSYATSGLIEDILPALDNMMLGLQSAKEHHPEAKGVIDGIDMVFTQLKGILGQHGVKDVNPEVGGAFDPNLHEAVAHVPSPDVEEGKVLAVQRIGYRLNERLIRPAAVVVSSGAAQA